MSPPGFARAQLLIWNIFRNVGGCVSYYEPLNERRWFDASKRGDRLDPSHRGLAAPYWQEYDGLRELSRWFRDDWTSRSLLMEESAWDPNLSAYFRILICHAAPKRAVFQCNRIDFRLPWVRRQFPGSRIIHLYRHPRDQWVSTLVDPSLVPRDVTLSEFDPYDRFYLKSWGRDLQRHFPFLSERFEASPYCLFYFIWKLSYIWGVAYSDHSLSFEYLATSPERAIAELLEATDMRADAQKLASLVEPAACRWQQFADDEWFRAQETACEETLEQFFGGQQ